MPSASCPLPSFLRGRRAPNNDDGHDRGDGATSVRSGNTNRSLLSSLSSPPPSSPCPPFSLETAAEALAASTFAYLEAGHRGLTKEKYDELLSHAVMGCGGGGGGGGDTVKVEEFYNRRGAWTIRCLCLVQRPGSVRVVFRGTDTTKNIVSDIKVMRATHPPKRGVPLWDRPAVHRGFLDAWRGDRLRESVEGFVLKYAKELQAEREGDGAFIDNGNGAVGTENSICNERKINLPVDPSPIIVDITGHSLGGSVAVLAAYDIAKALQHARDLEGSNHAPAAVRLYTLGCPRVGNVSFVNDFNRAVPHCWNIINDNDIVPAIPHSTSVLSHIWKGYRRHGSSVILKENGTTIINPKSREKRARERRVLRLDSALRAHETGKYRKSLRAAFRMEGLLDPNDARSTPKTRALDERLGLMDKVITEARADPNRSIAGRLLPGAT